MIKAANGKPRLRAPQSLFHHGTETLLIASMLSDAFVEAMEKFGFPGLSAFDIVNTGKQVREEIAATDPEKAAAL